MNTAPATPARLLLADGDPHVCRSVQAYLEPFGYEINTARSGECAVALALRGDFHAVVLDAMVPGLNGLDALRRIRESSPIPVLMLTSCGTAAERITALELGADDCIPKTYSARELLARLRAVLRRSRLAPIAPPAEPPISLGPLRVDAERHTAFLHNLPLPLTPIEFDLLHSLARDSGRVKSREQLLAEVADRHFDGYDRSIDVHISSLRRKLGDDPKSARWIVTVRSAGYLLRPCPLDL